MQKTHKGLLATDVDMSPAHGPKTVMPIWGESTADGVVSAKNLQMAAPCALRGLVCRRRRAQLFGTLFPVSTVIVSLVRQHCVRGLLSIYPQAVVRGRYNCVLPVVARCPLLASRGVSKTASRTTVPPPPSVPQNMTIDAKARVEICSGIGREIANVGYMEWGVNNVKGIYNFLKAAQGISC
uniref:Transposase n=2 Tax=Panagrellus redivivus TaxID=6233 RepID=A0A7E4UYJ1_PANRE